MALVRWARDRALGWQDPLAVDDLAGQVLVLDGVTAADDERLAWVRRAPCVTVALTPAGAAPARTADVSLGPHELDALDGIVAAVEARPRASRVLIDVLRATEGLEVPAALVVESLAYSALLAAPEAAAWLADRPAPRTRSFTGPPVRVERDGSELRIRLARPENRNALSAAMRDALFEALLLAEVDPSVEAVVLAGDGPVFCSGGDLDEFGTATDVALAHEIRARRSVGAVLARLAPRVTVRVHGACVGAGTELPAFAGRVVAAPDATFRLPEVGMGLIPGAGGTVSLPRRIGRQATARLALTGATIDAEAALDLGLVDEVR